ncbi:Dihydroneopterin aldolase-domain-containing protein [Exophiala viscosa]|uniref:dihydroneopterin aldolase n=1 Tax=Exophiala viscosa TaxID=2486360 RepID=A0AAN6E260_9EURO|nr:Dihydroneopterin aldolase-domain-containing protein [Exophiala viscosa]
MWSLGSRLWTVLVGGVCIYLFCMFRRSADRGRVAPPYATVTAKAKQPEPSQTPYFPSHYSPSFDTQYLGIMDKVILKNLKFDLAVGLDAWRRFGKPQPVSITVEVVPTSNLEAAAAQDNVNLSLDYGKLYKTLAGNLTNGEYPTIHVLISSLAEMMPDYAFLDIDIHFPKALLLVTGGVLYRLQVDNSTPGVTTPSLTLDIKQIACACIIGVNPHERLYKQSLFIDVSIPIITTALGPKPTEAHYTAELHDMVQEIVEKVDGSSYHTIEALASAVAQIVTLNYGHTVAKVRIEKPNAIATIEASAVEITRSKTFFENKDFWKVKKP